MAHHDRDHECRPLLSHADHGDDANLLGTAGVQPSPPPPHASFRAKLAHFWPIARVLVFAVLFGTCFYATQPSLLDEMRAFTCAFHYQRHPNLLPSDPDAPLPPDSQRPCAVPGVETKVGIVNAIATFAQFGLSSLSMLFYGPRLSAWGRKPLLLLATFSSLFGLLPYILLPLGYPFGPQPDRIAVSPTASMFILLCTLCAQGLMGDAPMIYLVMNALAVDASRPETRSIHLSWLLTATLVGCFLGPPLAAWALERSKHAKAHAAGALHMTTTTAHRWIEHPKQRGHGIGTGGGHGGGQPVNQGPGIGTIPAYPPLSAPPVPPGSPPAQPRISTHGNTAALKAMIVVYVAALLWTIFVIPETLKRAGSHNKATAAAAAFDDATAGHSSDAAADTSAAALSSAPASETALATKLRRRLGALSILVPVTFSSGQRDYRVTKMGGVVMFSTFGTMGLTYIALFASYRFDWGPEMIGLLIAMIGGTRAVWLLVGVPAINKVLERLIVRRRDGSVDESESDQDDTHAATLSTRAKIDIYLAMLSYLIEWIGYLIVIIGAGISSLILMIVGTLTLSLGAAANPAVNSAAISIVTCRKLHVDHQGGKKETSDAWISCSSIVDTFFKFFSPVCYSVVYSVTVESRVPAACFVIPLVSYGVAMGLLWSILNG